MILQFAATAVIGCAITAPLAEASVATVRDEPKVVVANLAAAPGESNRIQVQVTPDGRHVVFRELTAGVEIQAGTGCLASSPQLVTCTASRPFSVAQVQLGDGADRAVLSSGYRPLLLNAIGEQGHDILRIVAGNKAHRANLGGGTGNDRLTGFGRSNDRITGGPGRDRLTGGAGADVLDGGSGHDRLAGGNGADVLTGGSGDDVMSGGRGPDRFFGGFGNDRIEARDSTRDTSIRCGADRDFARVDAQDASVLVACERAEVTPAA